MVYWLSEVIAVFSTREQAFNRPSGPTVMDLFRTMLLGWRA
jgi:hypothetical protein